jgi:hypothetical protein
MVEFSKAAVESESQDHYNQKEEESCKEDGTMHILITRTVQITVVSKHEVVDT